MKKLKLIICILTSTFMFAQNAEKSVLESILETYNSKDFVSFYNLLSNNFKAQMSQKDLDGFLGENIYPNFGNLKSIKLKSQKESKTYNAIFERGNLDLMLVFNSEFKIDGLRFSPPKPELPPKINILSDNKLLTKLDTIVENIVKPFIKNPVNAGISIGIIQNGETTFYHYGEAQKETAKLPTNNTIYEIGSITKTFTGYLLAQAITDKKVSLDGDIRKYMAPKYANLEFEGNPILIKHLVNHTSTLPRLPENLDQQLNFDPENPYINYSKEMISIYLQDFKMKSQPGIKQEYSNFGVALLGIILENVYKMPFKSLVKNYISSPFKMKNTFENVPANLKLNFATGYNPEGLEAKHWDLGSFVAAGGIKSTIEDMIMYLQENISETNPKIALTHEITFSSDKQSNGLAWVINKTKDNNTFIWHNGGTGGFTSFCGFIKEKKCGVVILNNSSNSVDNLAVSILKKL
jgi:CubicO group peptidase (beta-lactamase class C family)